MYREHRNSQRTKQWVSFSVKDFLLNAPMEYKGGNYTKPALRENIKNRILRGGKGGRPGQWSARKAQLLALAYRKAGGGYRTGRPSRAQRSLRKWTKQRWRTSDGGPAQRGGRMRRYLPDAVWKRLTPAQRAATNRKKLQGDKKGKQFVRNTETVGNIAKRYRAKS
jgi:hypothetical protein